MTNMEWRREGSRGVQNPEYFVCWYIYIRQMCTGMSILEPLVQIWNIQKFLIPDYLHSSWTLKIVSGNCHCTLDERAIQGLVGYGMNEAVTCTPKVPFWGPAHLDILY